MSNYYAEIILAAIVSVAFISGLVTMYLVLKKAGRIK